MLSIAEHVVASEINTQSNIKNAKKTSTFLIQHLPPGFLLLLPVTAKNIHWLPVFRIQKFKK